MSELQNASASSSSRGVDYVRLCEDIVQRIEGVLNREKIILNGRQCTHLAVYLSRVIVWVREIVGFNESQKPALAPALAALSRYYERAERLVRQCGEEDWCAAAVFQLSNDMSIVHIMGSINFVLTQFFFLKEDAESNFHKMMHKLRKDFPDFSEKDADEDREDLRQRLEGLVSEQSNSTWWIFGILGFFAIKLGTSMWWIFGTLAISGFLWIIERLAALKEHSSQHLARYLLHKDRFQFEQSTLNTSEATPIIEEALKPILWEKDNEPNRTWGDSKLLGAGAGASGVMKTSWLGVPCARKEFHDDIYESMFLKEAFIMARLKKHPCIVDFVCCGNGKKKGDRFIAMELMEKSLYDLIKERKGVHFSLEVALDIIWQIADGVGHLHQNRVAHRDLKPQNVLVKTIRSPYHEVYYSMKLADFGSCKSEVEVSTSYKASYKGVGTTRYRAPEAFPNAHPEGLGKVDWMRADAYSFAMTCAHLLTLKQPFEEVEFLSTLYEEILKGRRPILPWACPKELVELLEECWNTNRSGRPKFDANFFKRLQKIVFNYRSMHLSSMVDRERI